MACFLEETHAAASQLRQEILTALGDSGAAGLQALVQLRTAPSEPLSQTAFTGLGAVVAYLLREQDMTLMGYGLRCLTDVAARAQEPSAFGP